MGLASFNQMRRRQAAAAEKDTAPAELEDVGQAVDVDLTDDELRAAIETATGKAPHHKTGRAKLLEQYAALPAGAA